MATQELLSAFPATPSLAGERESVTAAALKETVEATPPLVTGYMTVCGFLRESAAHWLAMDNSADNVLEDG